MLFLLHYSPNLIIENEKAETLRLEIVQSCIELRPMNGSFAVVRSDPALDFKHLLMIQF